MQRDFTKVKRILNGFAVLVVVFGILAIVSTVWGRHMQAKTFGAVNTAFHVFGSDKIVMQAYDDPVVQGVTCYLSRAKTGGLKGAVGLAEDKSDASLSCKQTGDQIVIREPLPQQADIADQRISRLFKTLHVVRTVDRERNVLVYMTYSDKLIDGSPKNSISAVPVPRNTPIPVKE